MFRFILYFLFFSFITCCNNKKDDAAIHYPGEQYEFIAPGSIRAPFNVTTYVPIYSHVYILNGRSPLNLAATLSIRSTDIRDSIIISKVDYYNSKGQLVKKYLDKILLLKPMHSAEFVVEEVNTEGGAGAYFLINSSATKSRNHLLVQAIMVSQAGSLGVTFKTEGITLDSTTN